MLEQAITPGYGLDVAGRGRECFMKPVVVLGGGLVTEERPPSAVECAAPPRAKSRNLASASRAGHRQFLPEPGIAAKRGGDPNGAGESHQQRRVRGCHAGDEQIRLVVGSHPGDRSGTRWHHRPAGRLQCLDRIHAGFHYVAGIKGVAAGSTLTASCFLTANAAGKYNGRLQLTELTTSGASVALLGDVATATNVPSGSWVQLTVTGVVKNAADQVVLSGISNSVTAGNGGAVIFDDCSVMSS